MIVCSAWSLHSFGKIFKIRGESWYLPQLLPSAVVDLAQEPSE